jgi:hypothetical protein
MLDGQLISFLGAEILTAVAASDFGPIEVVQKGQPTQEGVPDGPTVFFEKLFHTDVGWPMVSWVKDPLSDQYIEEVTQRIETTFQITALWWQDPLATKVVTASDLVNQVNLYFKLPSTIGRFLLNKISLLRVREVRNPYFENDRHQFEAHPSFDLVLTHNTSINTKVGAITTVNSDIQQATP